MKTLADFQNEVFIINSNNEVESMTYESYLNEYHSDETTSPRGVENRIQLASVLIDADGEIITYSLNDRDGLIADENEGEELKWALYNWGVGGNKGSLERNYLYDSEEDAYTAILVGKEYDYHNRNTNSPYAYDSEEEAEESRVEMSADAMGVDKEVFLSIEKKQQAVDCRRKEIAIEISNKFIAEQEIVLNKYSNLISKVEGESYKQTEARLSEALPEKIAGQTFHKLVKLIRK